MSKFLTHEQPNDGPRKRKKAPKPATAAEALPESANLSGLEVELAGIAKALRTYAINAATGENALSLSTGYDTPLKIALASNDRDDTMDRLVTAFERIADSVARLACLSRPRLESWHEQDEYVPRNKDIACDGGAPGPKAAA